MVEKKDLMTRALLSSDVQLEKNTFSLDLIDILEKLPANMKIEQDLRDRVIMVAGVLHYAKIIVGPHPNQFRLDMAISRNLYRLNQWASNVKSDEFRIMVIKTAIDILSLVFRSEVPQSPWFNFLISDKVLDPDMNGEKYLITVNSIPPEKLKEAATDLVRDICIAALRPHELKKDVRIKVTKQMRKSQGKLLEMINNGAEMVRVIIRDLQEMDIMTPEGNPKVDVFDFIKGTQERIKKILKREERERGKCPYCKEYFIPRRKTRKICYKPECKVKYVQEWRKEGGLKKKAIGV